MADLILGNTTVMTESGGTVTLNEGTLGSAVNLASATFPAGHVIQTKSVSTYVAQASSADVTYSTTPASSGTLSATLDSNGIYRLKDSEGSYLTIPNFSAKQGNLLIATISYGGSHTQSNCWYSFGVQWGAEYRRTFKKMGYDGGGSYHAAESVVLTHTLAGDISNATIHALLRIEESGKTLKFATNSDPTANVANYGKLGGSRSDTEFYFIIQEVQQ